METENGKKSSRARTALLFGLPLLAAAGIAAALLVRAGRGGEEEAAVYREETVQEGDLTVGITESGSVTIGTTTQEFALDLSDYTGSDGETASGGSAQTGRQSGAPGGFDLFSFGGNTAAETGGSSRSLLVEEVFVRAGQEIREGDPLYRLSEESTRRIREALEEDVSEARLDLQQAQTQQKKDRLSAVQDYETDTVYGEAAQLEYDETAAELTENYEEASQKIRDASQELEELQQELEEAQETLAQSEHLYDEAAYMATYIDSEDDPYGYASAAKLRDGAKETREADEDAVEEKQDAIEAKQEELEQLKRAFSSTEKESRSGLVKAQAQLERRNLRYEQAQERYETTLALSDLDVEEAEDACREAEEKLEAFDSQIADQCVLAASSGIVTQAGLAVGDAVTQGAQLLTMKDYDKTTIAVTLTDSEIQKVAAGDTVSVTLSAFPDQIYSGTVEEIGSAQTDAQTSEVTYEVTVRLSGDLSGVYSDMTGTVTFLTKEKQHVVYVPNRAVWREGTRSYVYRKDEAGDPVKQEVVTGFSDGVNAEIQEGLTPGDIVLIESRVSGS